jgi:5-hydroxyisourate hydrolase-like protein (transthyretin family)
MKEAHYGIKGMINSIKVNRCITTKIFPTIVTVSLLLALVNNAINVPILFQSAYAIEEFDINVNVDKDEIERGDTQHITATVLNDDTGDRVSNADVKLIVYPPDSDSTSAEDETDNGGEVRFDVEIDDNAETGTYDVDVRVSKDGYDTKTVSTSFDVVGSTHDNNSDENDDGSSSSSSSAAVSASAASSGDSGSNNAAASSASSSNNGNHDHNDDDGGGGSSSAAAASVGDAAAAAAAASGASSAAAAAAGNAAAAAAAAGEDASSAAAAAASENGGSSSAAAAAADAAAAAAAASSSNDDSGNGDDSSSSSASSSSSEDEDD